MTTHEFDAYCDTLPEESDSALAGYDVLYMEQLQDEAEMQEARETALQRLGAKEALEELKSFLSHCAIDDRFQDEFCGLKCSIDAIARRLAKLAPAEVKGGAA